MKNIKKIAIGVILIVLVILTITFLASIQGKLFLWGINLDLSGFKITSFTKTNSRLIKEEYLEVKSNQVLIRIQKSKVETNQKLISDRIEIFNSLFEPTTSPYPEIITNIIECSPEFKPKVSETKNGKIFTLFAGERFNYGLCSQDLIRYKSLYGIFDCKNKGVFEIRTFGNNLSQMQKIMQSFSCNM